MGEMARLPVSPPEGRSGHRRLLGTCRRESTRVSGGPGQEAQAGAPNLLPEPRLLTGVENHQLLQVMPEDACVCPPRGKVVSTHGPFKQTQEMGVKAAWRLSRGWKLVVE